MEQEEEEVETEVSYSTRNNLLVWENGTMTGRAVSVGVDRQQQQPQQQQQADNATIPTAIPDGGVIPDRTTSKSNSNSRSGTIVTGGKKKKRF